MKNTQKGIINIVFIIIGLVLVTILIGVFTGPTRDDFSSTTTKTTTTTDEQ